MTSFRAIIFNGQEEKMLPLFRLLVHSALLAMAWNHPLTLLDCTLDGNNRCPQLPYAPTLVLACYTMWIGFELGTTIMESPIRKDMLFHHLFTVVAVIVAWQQSVECIGYGIVRSTLLCEPFVDLYFLFKNSRLHAVTDTLLFVSFPFTRIYGMYLSVVQPILFDSVIDWGTRTQSATFVVIMLIYGMQWMWSYKIVRGGIAKLMN